MTLDEFIDKYDGKGIDYDGSFGNQCVDLYRQYVKEVLGYPQSPPVVGAKDIWDTYLPEYFKRIENTPTGIPEKGDIVIFGTGLGRFGHVSVFIEGTMTRFKSFDQNYPTGSLCHVQGHTYNAVLGWLTPLQKPMDTPEYFKTLLQEAGLDLNNEGEFRAYWEKAKRYDEDIQNLNERVKSLADNVESLGTDVSALTEGNQKLRNRLAETEEALNQERNKFLEANKESLESKAQVEVLQRQVDALTKELEQHQNNNNLYGYSWWRRFFSLFKKGGE